MDVRFNLTLHNMGVNNVEGLTVEVTLLINDSVVDTATEIFYSPNNFTLQAGEIREINGWIVTTLNVLDRASGGNVKIGGVNEGWTYKVTVKMGDKILDEYSLLKDRSVP